MTSAWRSDTLPGGLPLVMLERPGAGLLAARLWIRGGSSQDPQGQRGAAQLLAGVLSRGCGHLSGEALADLVEGHGAGLRCEAGEDGTLISLQRAQQHRLHPVGDLARQHQHAALLPQPGAEPLAGGGPGGSGTPAEPADPA
ncbi:MAG: hypothetical protein ACKOPS_20580, partial [Cyanobium sp.]